MTSRDCLVEQTLLICLLILKHIKIESMLKRCTTTQISTTHTKTIHTRTVLILSTEIPKIQFQITHIGKYLIPINKIPTSQT